MDVQVIAYTSKISNGYTNPPEISGRPEAFIPDLPAIAGRFFLARGIAAAGRRATRTVGTQPAGGCILCRKSQKKGSNRFARQGVRVEKPGIR